MTAQVIHIHRNKCDVYNCREKKYRDGLCIGHFRRMQRLGTVMASEPLTRHHRMVKWKGEGLLCCKGKCKHRGRRHV